ncbi:amiloride-sensitive sodium channel subunit delta, partial [Daubentonia madagascariensis]
ACLVSCFQQLMVLDLLLWLLLLPLPAGAKHSTWPGDTASTASSRTWRPIGSPAPPAAPGLAGVFIQALGWDQVAFCQVC